MEVNRLTKANPQKFAMIAINIAFCNQNHTLQKILLLSILINVPQILPSNQLVVDTDV